MNHRHDQLSGGNDRIARLLNAASVTTTTGDSRKPRITVMVPPPSRRRSFCESKRDPSVLTDAFQRPRGQPHQCQHRESEQKTGDRQTRREREIEARESKLIDQIRDHVDPAAADQLWCGKCAEGLL